MSTDPFEPLMTFKPRIAGKRSEAELCGLPARERRLIDLCYSQGKTPSQAAKELGIGRPWASRFHARALASLGAAIDKNASYPDRREVQETDDLQRADWGGVRSSS